METAVAQVTEEVACVLIPQKGASLLLPNVSVAEILPWRRVKPLSHVPDWCLGALGWRGETLPVVRYERMLGAGGNPEAGRCMVIMNRSSSALGPAFYAIAAEGLPRMLQLGEDDLEIIEGPESGGPVRVRIGAEEALIPDLDFIESAVRQVGLH